MKRSDGWRASRAQEKQTSCGQQSFVIPVLLGQGRHLFEGLGPEHIELERIRVLEGEDGVTHMRYRVS
jgi:hypothetical protein